MRDFRIRRRNRSTFGAPTSTPLRAAIITIDAAKRSGIAIYVCGRLHYYCEVQALEGPQRRRVLRDASTIAEVRGLPLVCVLEVPFGGHTSAALSLSAVCALWRDSWRGQGHAAERMFEFTANEWRRELFGTAGMPRAEARKLEAAVALSAATRDMQQSHRHHTIGPDASAAICIGQVAIRSGAIASALGLSTRRETHTV